MYLLSHIFRQLIIFIFFLLFKKLELQKLDQTFFGLPKPDFLTQNIKFGVKRAQYPTKYLTFWVPESDFLLSDLFNTRLFATRSTTNCYCEHIYIARNICNINICNILHASTSLRIHHYLLFK